jgi:pilus assembly protein Flp/PilA
VSRGYCDRPGTAFTPICVKIGLYQNWLGGRSSLPGLNDFFSLFVNAPTTNQPVYCAGHRLRDISANRRSRERGMRLIWKFLDDQSGATAIEYALIAGFLSIVIVVAVNGIGTTLNGKFDSVNSSLK